MEKTNNFHIIFQKLMMEKYAKSLLCCKIMINFFLLNVFCFCTPVLSCMFSSLIYSFIIIQHCSSLMLTKKGCRNFFQCPALFLGSYRPRAASFFIHPKLRWTLFPLLSQIKAWMGSIPCAECQSHLWLGAHMWTMAQICKWALPPAFSSDAPLLWGQILYLPSQEFQNGSQGLLKIGGLYFLVCFFPVRVCTWQK